MSTLDMALLAQLLLNIVLVVQHVRLKRSCEYYLTMLRDWCASIEVDLPRNQP